MIRGTTPTLTFTLPFDVNEALKLWLTFSQKHEEVFTLEKEDLNIEENVITCRLTQQQTLSLKCNTPVEIQIRVAFTNESFDDALASEIITTSMQRILKDGEI